MKRKNKGYGMKDYLTGLLVATLAVFAPIKSTLISMLVLVLADLVTGVIAAYKKKQPISSAGLRRTVTKITIYLAAVCLGFVTETYLLEGFIPVSKIAAGLIGTVELASLYENLNSIHGSNLFKTLIEKLGSVNDATKKDGES